MYICKKYYQNKTIPKTKFFFRSVLAYLRDTALDLVFTGFENGIEGFQVFSVEKELFVFGLGLLYGLEELDDFLEFWREI